MIEKCRIDECEKPTETKGLCSMHYSRLIRTGETGTAVTFMRGGSKQHPLIAVYDNMKSRCYNQNNHYYKNYGGRGIKICDRWLESFWNFAEDMIERPSKEHQLERIDNDGDYSPENCRWATRREQGLNKRSNRLITYQGITKTLSEWSLSTGIHRATLADRIDKLGWSIEDVMTKPARSTGR